MFFDTTKAMLKQVHADVQEGGPIKSFSFNVCILLYFAGFCLLGYVYSLGLPEPLTWILWGAGVAPFLFFYVLWETNALRCNSLWPKVWYFRKTQIWPRQK